jgi:hypothetical protein
MVEEIRTTSKTNDIDQEHITGIMLYEYTSPRELIHSHNGDR